MNIGKNVFLDALSRMERQYRLDIQSHASYDDSELWMASITLLAAAIGTDDALALLYTWIYDCEFGRYHDERLPAGNNEELWDFLAIKQEK